MKTRRDLSPAAASRLWDAQGRVCPLGSNKGATGKPWAAVSPNFHIDHLWPVEWCDRMGITDPKVVNADCNLWIIGWKINASKSNLTLGDWGIRQKFGSEKWNWLMDFSMERLRHLLRLQKSHHPDWSVSSWLIADTLETLRDPDADPDDEVEDDEVDDEECQPLVFDHRSDDWELVGLDAYVEG